MESSEMVQLASKQEDLSSIPSAHVKSQVASAWKPGAERGQEDGWAS